MNGTGQPETRKYLLVQQLLFLASFSVDILSTMKVLSTLALFVSLSTAASILTSDSVDAVLERREVHQPYAFGASLESAPASVPENAPADYHTATTTLAEQQVQRRESLRKPRGTIATRDFYECATSVCNRPLVTLPSPYYIFRPFPSCFPLSEVSYIMEN
jgi:hypothetical protein